ncbi:MAG: glycoside hydrolase family 88 protein [Anaerolineales bacterium]|nr:glycoside hydrolase family 88 protein [Anaerolineales bacterium]
MVTRETLLPKCERAFDFAGKQLKALIEEHPDQFPEFTVDGKWSLNKNPWTNWCEGFLGGQLWLLYKHAGDDYWREKAEHYSKLIEHRKTDRQVHDLGFLFWSTYKQWYDLTSEEALNAVLIEAGQTMALRFKEKGQYLRSFLAEDSLFIDIMMNVGIVFYAAQETDDADLFRIANQHCLTTRKYLIRGDGSGSHEGIFDLESGEFLRQSTQQGWRNDSSWARGLAWALYGFGTVYEFTQDARYLNTACALADYYIEHTPAHGVPPNDWDDPEPKYPYESSAAAIAASGMLNLAKLAQNPAAARMYQQYAYTILDTLTSPEFLADQTPGYEGILKRGIYHLNKGLGVDQSVMWGEFFFLEAVSKVINDD